MVKTSNNYVFYGNPAVDVIDVQQFVTNTTGSDVKVADNLLPQTDNVYNIGSDTARWNTMRNSLTVTNQVRSPPSTDLVLDTTTGSSLIRNNKSLVPLMNDTYTLGNGTYYWAGVYAATVTVSNTLNCARLPAVLNMLLDITLRNVPLTFTGYPAYNAINDPISGKSFIKFPTVGYYAISMIVTYNFGAVGASADLGLVLKDNISNVEQSGQRFEAVIADITYPGGVPVPIFYGGRNPYLATLYWECKNTNERVELIAWLTSLTNVTVNFTEITLRRLYALPS